MKTFKAGNGINQGTYKSFQPNKINQEWKIEDMEVLNLLSQADRQLGRLDMYSEYIPNIDLFISMHVLKEATKSSKIEGTKTNIEVITKTLISIKIKLWFTWAWQLAYCTQPMYIRLEFTTTWVLGREGLMACP